MGTIRLDPTTVPMEIRYRRVPGYYNRSTYHVEIEGELVMDVRRVSDATWNRSATWRAYRLGADWSSERQGAARGRSPFVLASDTTREAAVKAGWRRLRAHERSGERTLCGHCGTAHA